MECSGIDSPPKSLFGAADKSAGSPIAIQLGEEIFGLIEILHRQVHEKFLGRHFSLSENWNWIQRVSTKEIVLWDV
jgi:hypothetical protein